MSQQLNQAIATRGNESIDNSIAAAAFTGSTNTSIVQMNVGAPAVVGGNSFTETRSATLGTSITISSTGIYHIDFDLAFTGAVLVMIGVGIGARAAPAITADPAVGVEGVIAVADADSNASMTQVLSLSAIALVSAAQIGTINAIVQFWATNSAGAAPVGVVAAGVQYRIHKLFNVPF